MVPPVSSGATVTDGYVTVKTRVTLALRSRRGVAWWHMGNTRRRLQSLFPASGLVVFTACAGMPPGTSPLTDQEREEVDAVIDELEVEMPMVEGLLGTADPLFNLEGQPTADNHLLIVGVGEVLLDIEGMVEADRVVVRQFEEQPQGIEAVARGSRTQSTQADDYIILTLSSEGELVLTPSLLMHEGTHYFSVRTTRHF